MGVFMSKKYFNFDGKEFSMFEEGNHLCGIWEKKHVGVWEVFNDGRPMKPVLEEKQIVGTCDFVTRASTYKGQRAALRKYLVDSGVIHQEQ